MSQVRTPSSLSVNQQQAPRGALKHRSTEVILLPNRHYNLIYNFKMCTFVTKQENMFQIISFRPGFGRKCHNSQCADKLTAEEPLVSCYPKSHLFNAFNCHCW